MSKPFYTVTVRDQDGETVHQLEAYTAKQAVYLGVPHRNKGLLVSIRPALHRKHHADAFELGRNMRGS